MLITACFIVALILAIIAEVQAKGTSLLGYAVILIALALLVGTKIF